MNIVAIVQADMRCANMPGKVMLDIAGQPMIDRVCQRVKYSSLVDKLLVVTSRTEGDLPLRSHCEQKGWKVYAGDGQDLLASCFHAAQSENADIVVRISGDSPLVDSAVIDRAVEQLMLNRELDLVSNIWPERRFPRGLDVEAFTMQTLTELFQKSNLKSYREQVTLAAYEQPQRFKIGSLATDEDWSSQRWAVETSDDLKLVRKVFNFFRCQSFVCSDYFSFGEVQSVFRHHPHWSGINRHVQKKAA